MAYFNVEFTSYSWDLYHMYHSAITSKIKKYKAIPISFQKWPLPVGFLDQDKTYMI